MNTHTDRRPSTRLVVSVSTAEDAALALGDGADLVDLAAPDGGALPRGRIGEIVRSLPPGTSASAFAGLLSSGDPAAAQIVASIADVGIGEVRLRLESLSEDEHWLAAIAEAATPARVVAVLSLEDGEAPPTAFQMLSDAGFAGIMLDAAVGTGGFVDRLGIASLGAFVRAARQAGIEAWIGGGLEPPDIPRLLALAPSALCVPLEGLRSMRRLVPATTDGNGGSAPSTRDPQTQEGSALSTSGPPAHDTRNRSTFSKRTEAIFVRDFVLPVRIGAYAYERGGAQRVRFDVSVRVTRPAGRARGMEDVLSYDLLTDAITSIVAEEHFDLVEVLAERIAERVLANPLASEVTVRIEKLDLGRGTLGVELTAERPR